MASKNGTTLDPPKDTPPRSDASTSAPNRNSRPNQNEERLRFWEAFKAGLEENGIPPKRSGYYVQWAKELGSEARGGGCLPLAGLGEKVPECGKGMDLAIRIPGQEHGG